MAEIAAMTKNLVEKAKGYSRDSIPGDYATLQALPELRRRDEGKTTAATPALALPKAAKAAASASAKPRQVAPFETAEVEQFLTDHKIGPLEGFRSKALLAVHG